MSVRTGIPTSFLILSKTGKDFSNPAPLLPFKLVLLALSKDVLYIRPMPNFSVIFFKSFAIVKACFSFSSWQGPAIRVKGPLFEMFNFPHFTVLLIILFSF